MLRHVVLWKLSAEDEPTRLADSSTISRELQGLVSLVPEIQALTVATDATGIDGNWDVVLTVDCTDEEGLRGYIAHPEHQRAAAVVRRLVSARAVVDYPV
jgi:hypothetical protein